MTDVIGQDQDAAESSLFRRIGGEPAVAAAVDGLYERIVADDELASYFSGVDLARLKAHQRAFLTSALGGPLQYRGRPMDDAHRHLAITATAYDRVVGHIVDTLESLHVDRAVTAEVTAAVRSLQPQVVADRRAGPTATTIVYDSFTGADYDLDDYLSKWNNGFGPGEMAIEDTRTFDGSSFTVSALPFRTAADAGIFDHIKYLALSNESFAVPINGSITFAASIDATTTGTDPSGRVIHGIYGPPGCADDPACAVGRTPWTGVALEGQQAGATLHMIDLVTGQLFDWFVSGSTAFALIERLPATVTGSPLGATPDTMYTQIVKEVAVGPGRHDLAITFARKGGTSRADFRLDGRRVARVRNIGVPLDVQRARFTGTYPSLGPGEQLGSLIDSMTIGHGLFSLLDAFPFQHPDAPELSVSIPRSERIWGQGAAATFDDFTVTIDDRG